MEHSLEGTGSQRHTPMFACAKAPLDAILAQLANMD
jgi:hypothetical protein